jgi:hypothetical protein
LNNRKKIKEKRRISRKQLSFATLIYMPPIQPNHHGKIKLYHPRITV